MSELSPVERLAKLHALEEWLAWQLQDTRRRIDGIEQQIRDVEQSVYVSEQDAPDGEPARVVIHRAGCTDIEKPVTTLTADKARWALANDPRFFRSCDTCKPGQALGVDGA
jgi:uncharacterized lipoprotein YddW (UPF0748 family)